MQVLLSFGNCYFAEFIQDKLFLTMEFWIWHPFRLVCLGDLWLPSRGRGRPFPPLAFSSKVQHLPFSRNVSTVLSSYPWEQGFFCFILVLFFCRKKPCYFLLSITWNLCAEGKRAISLLGFFPTIFYVSHNQSGSVQWPFSLAIGVVDFASGCQSMSLTPASHHVVTNINKILIKASPLVS